MSQHFKPRVRLRSNRKFGIVVKVDTDRNMEFWQCACGSTEFKLNINRTLSCASCKVFFNGTWSGDP